MKEIVGMSAKEFAVLVSTRKNSARERKAFNRRRYKRHYQRVQEANLKENV